MADPYSLLGLSLMVQILTGVTLAMKYFSIKYPNPLAVEDIVAASGLPLLTNLSNENKIFVSPNILKNKILSLRDNNSKSLDEFLEWLRGFTDAEGYFFIQTNYQKYVNKFGEIITFRSLVFSFIIHLSLKDKDVLYTISLRLGGIGKIIVNEKYNDATLIIRKRQDVEKLLEVMSSYFSRLNTTKVLDFLAWNNGRVLFYKYTDERDSSIPSYINPAYTALYEKIVYIKNSSNKSRTDYTLPSDHIVTITKQWLLGFVEGEGCFVAHTNAISFALSQTAVNRYVLVAIKDYLLKFAGSVHVTVTDYKTKNLNQKPYSVLYVGKNKSCALTLIALFIDSYWLSVKTLDFIDWVIIYLLVVEGKHHLKKGKVVIDQIKTRMNLKRGQNNQEISQEIRDLLFSMSNYTETDQTGVLKIIESLNRVGKKHLIDSYVLASNAENTIGFRSNAACSDYFSVSKVSVGRWINRNSPVLTKKGTFLFQKLQK